MDNPFQEMLQLAEETEKQKIVTKILSLMIELGSQRIGDANFHDGIEYALESALKKILGEDEYEKLMGDE
jgi:hypothetical protein